MDSIATSKGITFAELMRKQTLDVSGSTHLWLDLPLGGRWKATKMDALRDRINSMIKVSQDNSRHIPILMMVPYGNGQKRVFPYKRWSHLLTKWRPHSEIYCSCQFFPEDSKLAKAHLKARVFASRFRLPKKQLCSTYAKCMEPGHRAWRCFQRTLTSSLLASQRSTSKDTMLVGEVMAHQGSPPERYHCALH